MRWLLVASSLLALSGAVEGASVRIDHAGVFAYTHAQDAAWQSEVVIEAAKVDVSATTLTIGARDLNVDPDPQRQVLVTIQQWGDDFQRFLVTMRSGDRTGLNLTFANPGFNFALLHNGELARQCAASEATCGWALPNASSHAFTLSIPAGGAGGATPPALSIPQLVRDAAEHTFRVPDAPREFTILQWAGVVAGVGLLTAGLPQTRALWPASARPPVPPQVLVVLGAVALLTVYISSG